MSHGHGSHDTHDSGDHGSSALGTLGIGQGALRFVLIAILCVIMQGTFVALASPWGRVWPSMDSTRLVLPPANLKP